MIQYLQNILSLPNSCLANKKITKAFFKRNFELTATEIKFLDDFSKVIQIDWLASVKPDNSNILATSADQFIYEEIQIISVLTGDEDFDKNKQRIAEIIQKYIPYHLLLCIYNSSVFFLNTCDKRINQNDATKRTIEKYYFTENINIAAPSDKQKQFIKSLAFSELDKHNLKTFFDSYTNRIIAIKSIEVLGSFSIRSTIRSKQDIQHIEKIAILQSEIISLHNQAKKETQISLQVNLNAEIQERRKEIRTLENLIKK